jgi:HK97 family phage prohead protease
MGKSQRVDFGDLSPENSLMHERKPDFSGWATKANLKCSDGRVILPGAFAHQDKVQVPLVWQHGHSEPSNVLGHAILENRDNDGVYCYGYFNDTDQAKNAKTLVSHKDISALSIFANNLVEKAKKVSHGIIREVSLVLAGANPGALIDNIELQHDDGGMVTLEDEAVIYTGELLHSEESEVGEPGQTPPPNTETSEEGTEEGEGNNEEDGPTVQDVYDSMSEEQKEVVHFMVGEALNGQATTTEVVHSDGPNNEEEDSRTMTRNVFEQQNKGGEGTEKHELSHDAIRGIVESAHRSGSLKEAVEEYALEHGIENIDILFPDARNVTQTPEFDKRRTEWVASVINGTNHSPFSRIKSIVADITQEEARARGYIKGTLKKEEWFGLTKRVTTPSTIYKKQRLDRDDIIDITDFDVVAWLKGEMRLMLDEELARAVLIGDGRAVDHEDKIKDPAGSNEGAGIRSILHDDDLYAATVNVNIDDANSNPSEIVDAVLLSMGLYKGSGSPTFYTTLPMLTKMLLAKDTLGRRLYRTASELASELQVSSIQTVEVLEQEEDLIGIIVNLRDYTLGADRGGDVSMFDDFDIDYNQYKYLIETRLSGALTKIRSALVVKKVDAAAELIAPEEPDFDPETGIITIPTDANVDYFRADTGAAVADAATIDLAAGASLTITATPASGYYFANNVEDEWTFTADEA